MEKDASVSSNSMPEEAKGKTSKRTSKNIEKMKLPPGKAQERNYSGSSLPAPAEPGLTVEVPVFNGVYVDGLATRLKWHVENGKARLVAKETYMARNPLRVQTNIKMATTERPVIIGPYSPPHKPVISARNLAEATYFAKILLQHNPAAQVAELHANGLSASERYAESLGIDIPALRQRGDVYTAYKGESTLLRKRHARILLRTYQEELERKIAIEENPLIQAERKRAAQRAMRHNAHEQNRAQNKKAKSAARSAEYNAKKAEQNGAEVCQNTTDDSEKSSIVATTPKNFPVTPHQYVNCPTCNVRIKEVNLQNHLAFCLGKSKSQNDEIKFEFWVKNPSDGNWHHVRHSVSLAFTCGVPIPTDLKSDRGRSKPAGKTCEKCAENIELRRQYEKIARRPEKPKPIPTRDPLLTRTLKSGLEVGKCDRCPRTVTYVFNETQKVHVAYDVVKGERGERHVCRGTGAENDAPVGLSGGAFETDRRKH